MEVRKTLHIFFPLLGCYQELRSGNLRPRWLFGLDGELRIENATRNGKRSYFIDAAWEEYLGNARDLGRTKAAWRGDVGQSGKHSV
jgi:hypothetical protein